MIQIRALGPLKVTVDGASAPADLLWRHNLALLLYLARAPAHRCTRDHAIGLLWPEKDQAAARQSLREAVRILRRHVGEGLLRTEADQLELAAAAVELDTDRFDQLLGAGDCAGAAALVAGGFAEGFSLPDASAFEDWLLSERWYWRGHAMDALTQHAEQRLAAGDLLGADEPARRALQLDPLSDRAVRTLMRRLALAGDRSAALDLHRQFVERAPAHEPETDALADRLRRGREWKLPAAAVAANRGVEWRRTPLVGRERELGRILDQWRGVRTDGFAIVLAEGVAGGGKSRLAEEVMSRAALERGACVATRAVPADLHQALSGIVSLTRGGLLDTPGVAAAPPAALGAIAHEVPDWADRFAGAARSGPRGHSLGQAIIDVLRAASVEQPLLLVVDDAQWLDAASLEVIETMARDLARAPILVLLTATPEPSTPKLAELRAVIGRDVRGTRLALPVLDDAALRALVQWAFPPYREDQVGRLARRIAADSAGLPLLAVEICHALAQGLDVESTSGAWPRPLRTLDQTLPGDLPETIVAAIRVGFNCLSPDARAALAAASVIAGTDGAGGRVAAERIGLAAGLAADARDAALDELEWRRWLVADPRGYSFVARIVRDVIARDLVTEGQRQRFLHA